MEIWTHTAYLFYFYILMKKHLLFIILFSQLEKMVNDQEIYTSVWVQENALPTIHRYFYLLRAIISNLFLILILLEYSSFTVSCQFQVYSYVIQLYTYGQTGYSPWGCKEPDTTEQLSMAHAYIHSFLGPFLIQAIIEY